MKGIMTQKQVYLLRMLVVTAVIYFVFQYLLPLVLPFLVAFLLALLIRPAVRFLYKGFHIPMGIGAGIVLVVVLVVLAFGGYYVGRLAVEQLVTLGQQLPDLWDSVSQWLWDCCEQVERGLHLADGTITENIQRIMAEAGESGRSGGSSGSESVGGEFFVRDQIVMLVDTSLQSAVGFIRWFVSVIVVVFVTLGATLITTTQLESLRQAANQSLFGKEIRQIKSVLVRVGTAYGKTQLVIMACTVTISGVGLTILGDPYALLWSLVIGLVDALPLFGAGTILWPWLAVSLFRGQWARVIGLAVIYGISNLTRQWLEARYMGDRIGISPLANLIAMYVGLQLFGVLGLFLGPLGYLLIKESLRESETASNSTQGAAKKCLKNSKKNTVYRKTNEKY